MALLPSRSQFVPLPQEERGWKQTLSQHSPYCCSLTPQSGVTTRPRTGRESLLRLETGGSSAEKLTKSEISRSSPSSLSLFRKPPFCLERKTSPVNKFPARVRGVMTYEYAIPGKKGYAIKDIDKE